MSAKWAMQFKPTLDELSRVAELVENFGRQEAWEPELIFQMQLVVEEVGTNIVEHGGDSRVHSMEIMLASDARAIVLDIMDDGHPFNPLQDASRPDVSLALEDRPLGGLGLHLIQTLMDDKNYRREQGRNHLTLVKYRVKGAGNPAL